MDTKLLLELENTITKFARENALELTDHNDEDFKYDADCHDEQLPYSINFKAIKMYLLYHLSKDRKDGYKIFFKIQKLGSSEKACLAYQEEEEGYEILPTNQDDVTMAQLPIKYSDYNTSFDPYNFGSDKNFSKNNKLQYGHLSDMYAYVSQMDAHSALKHGKGYFKSLRVRTESFISDLKPQKFAMAQKMRDNFNFFLKNMNGKLEKENEIWDEINDLKEEWNQVKSNFEKLNNSTNLDTEVCDEENIKITTNSKMGNDLLNTVQKQEKKFLVFFSGAIMNSTKYENFLPMKMQKLYNISSIYELYGESKFARKCDSGSSSSPYLNLSTTQASFLYKDILHGISNSFQLFDKQLPEFQSCTNTENLICIFISTLNEVVKKIQQKSITQQMLNLIINSAPCEIYEKNEVIFNQNNAAKMYFKSQKPSLKRRSLSEKSFIAPVQW